jgi:hypothetical protein
MRFRLPLACLLAAVAGFVPASSIAQAAAAMDVPPIEGANPQTPSPTPALAGRQLEEFAKLVGEPASVVSQHLLTNPGLVPNAAAAADARMKRRSTGATLTIVGGTLFGVGSVTASIILLNGLANPASCDADVCESSSLNPGLLVGLSLAAISVAAGLALGIPGIIRLSRQSTTETEAAERYQSSRTIRPAIPISSSARAGTQTLSVPLFTWAF